MPGTKLPRGQRAAENPRPDTLQQALQASSTAGLPVSLRYLQTGPIQMRGPVTGRHYEFSNLRPIQAIDPRDAAVLLRTRFFRRT